MTIGYAMVAAATAAAMWAGGASAQPEYGYGQLPRAPYVEAGGYAGGGGGCGGGDFTLLGARAGVTVLGFDVGANAHFTAPTGEACGGGGAPAYPPAPPAPPEPMAYGPPAYGPAAYGPGAPSYGYGQEMPAPSYGYAPMGPPPQAWGYAQPCGCEASGR